MLRATAIIIAGLVAAPSAAIPCINAVRLEGDRATKQVAQANDLLSVGKPANALRLVDRHRYEFVDDNLAQRAALIRAIASIRLDRNVPASYQLIRDRRAKSKDDPVLTARLAEAMLRRADFKPRGDWDKKHLLTAVQAAKMRADAMAMMLDLAKRDLMPDAFAYLTLARIHARDGDAKPRDAALARCRKMTKARKLCKL